MEHYFNQEGQGGLPEEGHLHGDQNDEHDQQHKRSERWIQAVGTAFRAGAMGKSRADVAEAQPGHWGKLCVKEVGKEAGSWGLLVLGRDRGFSNCNRRLDSLPWPLVVQPGKNLLPMQVT